MWLFFSLSHGDELSYALRGTRSAIHHRGIPRTAAPGAQGAARLATERQILGSGCRATSS